MTVSSTSSPILRAAEFLRARYSLSSLILFITAVAVGLGLGRIAPSFVLMVGVFAFAVCAVFGVFRAAVGVYRRLLLRCPTRLVPLRGPANYEIVIWADWLLVGRHSCCDIVLSSPAVSGRHCRLNRKRRGLYVIDLDSQNGTYINGRPIQTGRLYVGDRVLLADREFVVR